MRIQAFFRTGFFVVCGLIASYFVAESRRPDPRNEELHLHESEFNLERKAHDPLMVRPEKWQPLPALRADFDLLAEVEIGEGGVLDLVLRRTEPHAVQGLDQPFHGRFTVLRLSAGGEGPAWRTPAEALLGSPYGVKVAPGLSATVQITARGRTLSANVAGKVLPPFTTMDDVGSIALITRGASAAFTRLQIVPVQKPMRMPLWAVSLAIALFVEALALSLRVCLLPRLLAGAALAFAPLAIVPFALAALPPLAQPDARDEVLLLFLCTPVAALILIGKRRALFACLPLLLVLVAGTVSVQQRMATRFPATTELDELLGPDAGLAVIESLANCVRGAGGLHMADAKRHFVFLLGGQLLYQRADVPGKPPEHVDLILDKELHATDALVEVAALPTVDGYTAQQWRLFTTCFTEFRPKVVVFGVPRDEDAPDAKTHKPRSSPGALEALIAAAERFVNQQGAKLVLLADCGLELNLMAVLRRANQRGLPLLAITDLNTANEIGILLAAQIAPLLK